MKGKVTKDILLRVGQGVMRIPRPKEDPAINNNQNNQNVDKKRSASAGKTGRS